MNYQNGLSIAGSNPGSTKHGKSGTTPASKFARANNSHRAGSRASRAPSISADELEMRFSFQSYSDDTELELVSDVMNPGASQRALRDKRLLEQLYEQVAMRGGLETKDLRLLVHNSVVTIIGTVSVRAMRTEISNFLRECSPVKTVINRLKVREDNANAMSGDAQWQRQNMAA